jgi:hypothetical protein
MLAVLNKEGVCRAELGYKVERVNFPEKSEPSLKVVTLQVAPFRVFVPDKDLLKLLKGSLAHCSGCRSPF